MKHIPTAGAGFIGLVSVHNGGVLTWLSKYLGEVL